MSPERRPGPAVALLVRHGLTPTTGKVLPGRAPGLHLSDAGRDQAKRAAERLSELRRRPAALYCSPLERALETAEPIACRLGLAVTVVDGLNECDFGEWTGQSLATLRRKKEWKTVQQVPSTFRFPGGESFVEMCHRLDATVGELADRHQGESFVAVSHADPIKAVVAATAGMPVDLLQRVSISPTSVTAVVRGPGTRHVLCVNSTSTLAELVAS